MKLPNVAHAVVYVVNVRVDSASVDKARRYGLNMVYTRSKHKMQVLPMLFTNHQRMILHYDCLRVA